MNGINFFFELKNEKKRMGEWIEETKKNWCYDPRLAVLASLDRNSGFEFECFEICSIFFLLRLCFWFDKV